MGNDLSSTTTAGAARTHIPLDDSVCWQLYNGINEQSEPISIFIAKQTYSVECRRSIQFLKTIRHPNIIKFYADFKTFIDHDSFIADCAHPLANKLHTNDIDLSAKLGLGLYQLCQALEFLHEKASISHNNICLLSIYISLNGTWKLGNFECACRYDNINKKFLSSLKMIRSDECIAPEEDEKNSTEFDNEKIYAIDIYAFGTLIHNLMTIVNIDDSLKSVLNDLQTSLTEEDPQSRPTWSMLLKTQLFQIDYIKAIELLDRLPAIDESDLSNVVDSLSTYLNNLDAEYFNDLLIRRLCLPFMFLCSSTRLKIIPRIIIPKDDNNNSWISIDKYRTYVIPVIVDLYSYHVTCIRETLLENFKSYWQLIDKTILTNLILPQLIYGLKDSNNTICMLTLVALATMVPILGADVIIGGKRKQIFTDKIKKEHIGLPKTPKVLSKTNSPLPMPQLPQEPIKISPIAINKIKATQLKSNSATKTKSISKDQFQSFDTVSSQYTNGDNSSLNGSLKESRANIVPNGLSNEHIEDDIDNDDGQWSDWEHNSDPAELSTNYTHELPEASTLSSPVFEQLVQPKTNTSPLKSLKLISPSQPKWNPNAPLGSEYEIPPVVLTKSKSTKVDTSEIQDSDDFFKDMTPKVETVELMQQLETMFNVNLNHPKEQIKTKTTSPSFSSKFGIMSQDQSGNQETESGNNNWDE
ncbi:unnamed protein product [Rotaria magnacalcarata]|uniref:Protein kinase domain-containing protein n=1 Tax=Rotaria magnacalcarata TaxID=392030 RepID=A0A819DHZ7_9BILA|nr:unnamed protein product [Rotaria magnacalcarata]CAF3835850.1 unnamed protein product [Rotaria magnacalcarata]